MMEAGRMAESQLTELQNMRVLLLEVFVLQKPALQGPLYRTKIHNPPVNGYLLPITRAPRS